MITRREALSFGTSGLLLSLMPILGKSEEGHVRQYRLEASPAQHRFYEKAKASDLWLYNAQSPGPLISAQQGEVLDVLFVNNLSEPTTLHWHGIRNLNEMDGVPGLTQDAVEPGESFRYRFPLKDAGTFWYHAHNKAWSQVARGLYGPLIVSESAHANTSRDIVVLVDDWRLDEDDQIHTTSLGSLHDWSHGGRLGNFLTVNGHAEPVIDRPEQGPVRLRLISAANARIMTFETNDQRPMQVIAVDGAPCAPFEVTQVTLAPAQRVDVLIKEADALDALFEVSTADPLRAATFAPKPLGGSDDLTFGFKGSWYPQPDAKQAHQIDIHMQGGAMGNLTSAKFDGVERSLREIATQEGKLWAFNGEIGSYDLNLAEVSLGEIIKLTVWNNTRWRHAMHLHGQHFWVTSTEFGTEPRALLRDTYLMQAGERAEFLFLADNPGEWLFHCHMLEHHAAGMGGVISVS